MKVGPRSRWGVSSVAVAISLVAIVGVGAGVFLFESTKGRSPGTSSADTSTTISTSVSNTTTSSTSSTTISSTSTSSSTTTSTSQNSNSTSSQSTSTSTTTVTTTIATLPTPYPGGTLANLTYCSMAGVGLELDLYYPPSGFSPPYPLVVFVHGGGWISGDKVGVKDTAVYDMTKYGFIVGSVNYRLAPQYQFPAQIEDVKCAIRFLRANAAALWIDPGRIGAMGSSAGGHLVSLLGVTGSGTLWDVGEYTSVSSAVSAVMVLSGPENITMAVNDPAWINAVSSAFDDSYTLKLEGSPVNYPNGYSPPFLLEYGYNDTVVPYVQGVEFAGVMKSVGVNATLILVNNAGHVLVPVDPSIPEDPPLSTTRQDIVNFFIQRLGGGMMFSPGSLLPPGLEAGGLVVVAFLAALLRRDVRN